MKTSQAQKFLLVFTNTHQLIKPAIDAHSGCVSNHTLALKVSAVDKSFFIRESMYNKN
jgi:hypothetical protein